jgi:hypothetical protein
MSLKTMDEDDAEIGTTISTISITAESSSQVGVLLYYSRVRLMKHFEAERKAFLGGGGSWAAR